MNHERLARVQRAKIFTHPSLRFGMMENEASLRFGGNMRADDVC
jgi:hypothetical protein